MANNFNVKVNVEFNAIMGRLNNALEDFKAKLAAVGDAIGNKKIGTQLSSEFEKTVKKLNELNNTTITPSNVENYKKKLAELQDRLEKLKELQKELASTPFSVDTDAKKKELEDKKKELQDLLNNNKGVNFRKSRDWFAENAPQLQQQKEDYLRLQREIKKLTNEFNQADTAQKNYTDGAKVLDQVVDDVEQGTSKAADALGEYAVQAEKAANERLANTIQTQVNRYIGLNAIYRYSKKYLQDLIKTYKEFDESLVAIAAVTGQTRDQMWSNIGVYNKMAQSLGTTTQEVINASKLYYQQGLTTTSVLKLTEETVKLATIAELDSADATEYLTTAMNGFKLSAEESTRVTDVWANLAAKTASDVDELAVAISKVASLAENAGMEIETASAFLNQMIETTREAPENLGTALKTIIARFQELKVSEEALSDGVDANKVEKALRTANVELRDATGQFRDFDEVILDLSAKWNTLDRNTQRYIATIAAGSRQQSRFIAMVSDYEGLLRNVNYAYDSLGSADAQMAVFQEGLTASTNRLTAAWEGLYTSWSKSATVISVLIDFAADFVSTLADIGAGTSAIIAIIALLTTTIVANAAAMQIRNVAAGGMAAANIKNAASAAIAAASTEYERKMLAKASKTMLEYTGSAGAATFQNIELAASQALVVAQYALVLAAIGLVIYGIVKLINLDKDRIKQLEKEQQELQQLAAQEKDRASNAGVLIDEIKNVKNDEEALEEVRSKAIDQFGDQIEAINDTSLSYKELIEVLQQYQREQNKAAAIDFYKSQKKDAELDYAQKINDAEVTERQGTLFDSQHYSVRTYWVYNGKKYSSKEEMIADNQDDFSKEIKIPNSYAKFYASMFIDEAEIDEMADGLNAAIEQIVKQWNETGVLEEYLGDPSQATETIEIINGGLGEIFKSLDTASKSDFINFLKGNFSKFSDNQLYNFAQLIEDQFGPESPLTTVINEKIKNYEKRIANLWKDSGLTTSFRDIGESWALATQEAFLEKYQNSSQREKQAAIFWINKIQEATGQAITSLDSDDLWANFIENYDKLDESAKKAYQSLIEIDEVSFDHAKKTFNDLANDMATFKKVASDGLSADEFFTKAHDWAIQLQELSDAQLKEIGITREQALAWVLSNKELDVASGTYKLSTDAVKVLAEARLAEAKTDLKAALAEAKVAESQAQNALTAYDVVNALNTVALANAQTAVTTAFGADAWKIYWEYANGTISAEQASAKLEALGTSIEEVTASIQGFFEGGPDDEKRAALEQDLQAAKDLVAAYETDLSELEDFSIDAFLAGKGGASGADKESKKYLETLKKLADQLKETAEEAEAAAKREIAAILAVLEAEKAKLEEMQKEREEWRDKESEELELWIKAQIALLQEEQKAQEKAYQDNEDALSLQAEAAQTYYNQQIEAIQAKIDALDAESEAEDRLLKLQQARDAYNKAQNSKSRLVLTKGAGWIFKADQKEVADARKQLQDVQREIQKAAYQDQIDELQKQADEWEKIADGIGKSAEEIAKLAAAVEEFGQGIAAGSTGYADIDAFTKAVEALQEQKATMDFNADETAEGSLAYQIAQLEEALEKVGRSFEDQLLAERLEAITEALREQNEEQGYEDTTGQILGHVETYMQEFSKVAHEYSETAARIAEIEKSIELWKSIDENLGLTVEEIEEAKKLYDKYSKKFEKFGTKAFDEQSKAYQYMKEKLGKIAEYFSEAKEAEEKAKTYEQATKNGFSSGGVVDFYGPADLHGTIAEPEVVFNARQASALFNWVKSLSSFGIPQINGVNPTPVVTTSNNSMRTNTISIGELYINSSANNFDGLVADITRNSMLRQPI